MNEDKRLPYEFDLLYDIKTEEELAREIVQARRRYHGLLELCREHKIEAMKYIREELR
jgi:hypothetical protein